MSLSSEAKIYHWDQFRHQNTILKELVSFDSLPGVIFIDVDYFVSLRPDAHHKGDCLHFGGTHSEEVTKVFSIILINTLSLLHKLLVLTI